MRILRLETECGTGVFTCGAVYRAYDLLPENSCAHMARSPSNMPPPSSDPGIRRMMEYHEYCAFISFEQYRDWFGHEDFDEALTRAGIKMSEYDVPDEDVTVGETQVLFYRERAKKVDRQPISHYRQTPLKVEGQNEAQNLMQQIIVGRYF